MYFLPLLDKEPILKPMTSFHALGSLAHKSAIQVPGPVCFFLLLPLEFSERAFFLVPLLLSLLVPRAPHLEPWGGSLGLQLAKAVLQMHPRVQCEHTHTHCTCDCGSALGFVLGGHTGSEPEGGSSSFLLRRVRAALASPGLP